MPKPTTQCFSSLCSLVFLIMIGMRPAAGAAGLRAAPWPQVAGRPGAAAMLADLARQTPRDTPHIVARLRSAVRDGDVDCAFALAGLYFPVDGTLGRENFAFVPDIVMGYVWYAIGLAGLEEVDNLGGRAETTPDQAREVVDSLALVLLADERRRAAEILAGWPESLPPDTPLRPVPEPASGRDSAPPSAPADAGALARLLRQWARGEAADNAIGVIVGATPATDPVLAEAIAGIRADAEAGDADAMLLAALWALERGDDDEGLRLATAAAGKGQGRAMLVLGQHWRDRGDRAQAERWIEKAAEAGEWAAVQRMIGVAETSGDPAGMIQWLTVALLRAPDPAMAYRCRMLILLVGGDDGGLVRAAMDAGERWHNRHPAAGRQAGR